MKRILALFFITVIIVSLLCGCGFADSGKVIKHNITYSTLQSKGNQTISPLEYELVSQNDYVDFYFDSTTCYLYVVDKRTGKVWCSNPQEPANADEQSQILLSVRDSSGTLTNYNSYNDAVAKNQYEYKISDGVLSVTYTIGYANDLLETIPLGFTEERFEEILERCDKKQANLLEKRYTLNEEKSLWERKDGLTKNQTEKLAELFDIIDYTESELENDNASFEGTEQATGNSTFVLTLNYRTEEDSLVFSINASNIEATQNQALEKISILPYFGCLSANTDGYMLVPDGSGAIINTEPAFEASGIYSAPVYGQDKNYALEADANTANNILLPVFGINRGDDGLLAVIEDGKAIATVNASKPGITGNVAFAYSSYALDVVQDLSVAGNASTKYVATSTKRYDGEIRQRYIFLTKDYCDYSGMAVIYRDYASANGILGERIEDKGISFHLETIGTVTDQTSTLGVVHETNLPLTKYTDNISILKDLANEDITDVQLILSSWFNGGSDQKLANNVKTIGKLGGNSGFKKLAQYCGENSIGIYPTVLLNSFSKSELVNGNKYAAVDLAYNKVYLDAYDVVSGEKQDALFDKSRLILSSRYQYAIANKFLNKYTSRYETGLAIGDIASTVYSDMRKTDTVLRSQAFSTAESIIKGYSEKADLILSAPNDISAGYSDTYTNVPKSGSSYLCAEASVPFYQMVFHGYAEYSFTALNQTSNINKAILKCIEYGAVPKFTWIYNSDFVKANPQRAELYYTDYSEWKDVAVSAYKEINELLSDLRGCTIEKHLEISGQVFKTVYSDGTSIYVNYNDYEVLVNGITIPAVSAVKGG